MAGFEHDRKLDRVGDRANVVGCRREGNVDTPRHGETAISERPALRQLVEETLGHVIVVVVEPEANREVGCQSHLRVGVGDDPIGLLRTQRIGRCVGRHARDIDGRAELA